VSSKNQGAASSAAVEQWFNDLTERGQGIHAVKKDESGKVLSLMILGQARIHAHDPKDRELALLASKEAATWKTVALYAKWLSSQVAVQTGNNSRQEVAEGTIQHLQVLYVSVNNDSLVTTVVLGWKVMNDSMTESNQKLPEMVVRCEDSFETDIDTDCEHSVERIWIDGILVVETDAKVCGSIGESHERQWHSNGCPFVDVALKADEHKGRIETAGSFWNKSGKQSVVNETFQD